MKLIEKIMAIASLVGLVFTVYFFNEGRYAYAKDLSSVQQRLEYKIQSDQLNSTRERYWKLEDKLDKQPKNEEVKQEMKELKEMIDEMKENIRILKEK